MKITKIKIKNLYGISEYESDGRSVQLDGANGVGKSSVIDAIRYALTNKSERKYIVRNGETEGEILIEADTGLRINRKARLNQADYKSVKNNGVEVGSPETFLRDIFTPLQLSPVEFMEKSEKEQNSIILDMIEYDWNLQTIKEWFGEIPDWVSYDQNILQVLNDIQSERGEYFQRRQDINRDARNKQAFVAEIGESIPVGYDAEKWERANLSALYREIETGRYENAQIQKAKDAIERRDSKIRQYEADREIALATLDREMAAEEKRCVAEIERLEAELRAVQEKIKGMDKHREDKVALINKTYEAEVSKYVAMVDEYRELAEKEVVDFSEKQQEAENAEKMKSYLKEYARMISLQGEVERLQDDSLRLTEKIEKARALPGEILETATIPIEGLTVKDGIPLINGLPISNLSDGEKLDLCINVAIQKPNGLQIILIDGVEKLSTKLRNELYEKCKSKGLQMICTRTTDDEDLTVIEL